MTETVDTPTLPRKRRWGLKLVLAFLAMVLTLGGVEGVYRLMEPAAPPLPQPYAGWPLAAQWRVDREAMPQEARYYDFYDWSAPKYASATINFDTYHGYPCVSRKVPDSAGLDDCDVRVWLFGGSTMQHAETSDDDTIANHVAQALRGAGRKPLVVNFGTGGFTSSQEFVRFWDMLRRSTERQLPDFAVFYDGYNDGLFGGAHGPGVIGEDYHSRLAALVERRHGNLFWYLASESLGRYSAAWRRLGQNSVRNAFYREYAVAPADWSPERAAQCAEIYVKNVRSIQALSAQGIAGHRVTPVFLLQPLVFTKKPNTEWEKKIVTGLGDVQPRFTLKYYDEVRSRLRDERAFFDLSNCLDGRGQDDFLDFGHISPTTGEVIGRRIARILESVR